ncbi:MAG: AraC family transcriptional regulator [Lachnospiraceae bacterium]|nr:AraC family transcriptional regulator [Lachnospiraceae bacterium]
MRNSIYNSDKISAEFVTTHYVDEQFHMSHSQMLHRHEDVLELLYVMKGAGVYIVDGRKYPIGEGNLIICNQGVVHGEPKLQSPNSLTSYCCVLRGLCLPNMKENCLVEEGKNPVLYFSEDRDAVEHMFLALDTLDQGNEETKTVCEILSDAILNLVYMRLCQRQEPNELTHTNNEEFIQSIMDYMDEHYHEPITLQDLGDAFFISQYHLAHIFKDETGVSPMKYILYRKIGESQKLLMNTELSVGEIGFELGFNDNSHFSTTFKKYIGMTPSQYRNHFKKGTEIRREYIEDGE